MLTIKNYDTIQYYAISKTAYIKSIETVVRINIDKNITEFYYKIVIKNKEGKQRECYLSRGYNKEGNGYEMSIDTMKLHLKINDIKSREDFIVWVEYLYNTKQYKQTII